ncbi:unnamed protein product [Echinostoma caproni]|uniref:Choline transport protein n=1 Tax=Echinostoma caproni TaxID=27848 RepID=A0A183AP23_9TREM|nr:unnamed protein product [Echinostoma caproni]
MGSRYTATSLGTTNFESVGSVVDDLVSNRAVWRKICCIILCVLFVIDAWAVIGLHILNFTNQTALEATVSVVVLIVGQYIGIFKTYILNINLVTIMYTGILSSSFKKDRHSYAA